MQFSKNKVKRLGLRIRLHAQSCCCYIQLRLCGTHKSKGLFCLQTDYKPGDFHKRHLLSEVSLYFLSAHLQVFTSEKKKNCMQIFDHIFMPNICVGVNKPSAFELESRPIPPTSRPRPVHFLFRKC